MYIFFREKKNICKNGIYPVLYLPDTQQQIEYIFF